jgi:hypothetical protein
MPQYIFIKDYTAQNRVRSNSVFRIFRAGEVFEAEPHIVNSDLPKKIRERIAPAIIIEGKYIIPMEFVKVKESRNENEPIKIPNEKLLNLNGEMKKLNTGAITLGAVAGIAVGVAFAFFTHKSKFMFATIGLVGGAGIAYMLTGTKATVAATTQSGGKKITLADVQAGKPSGTLGTTTE